MVAPHNLSKEPILNLGEFHGRSAFFAIISHAVEPVLMG